MDPEPATVSVPAHPTLTGLTEAEAARRLADEGPNLLPAARPPAWWRQLLAQVTHFFAILLWIAGGLALVAGMPQLGIAIFVVVIVNGVFAFAQEHRAEQAAEKLRDLLPRSVRVIRDGALRAIDAAELVRGDLVALGPGDRVSADLELAEVHSLYVDASMLTGESEPVPLAAGATAYAGTFVVEGESFATVTAIGADTRLAAIAALARAHQRPPSPLALELGRLVRIIASIAVAVGVGFFVVAVILGLSPADGFLFAIGVTVALVPEGLLPTVTLSLARGAQRMADRHALVRRLESVETLGSTTFICTDKTGTLTRNEMEVLAVWTAAGTVHLTGSGYDPSAEITGDADAIGPARRVAWAARTCSVGRVVADGDRWVAEGDPMEAAIDALWRRLGSRTDGAGPEDITRRFPFDPRRRRMSVVAGDRLLVKGAPESVLPRCRPAPGAAESLERLAAGGLRVLAVAARSATDLTDDDPDVAEADLELLGLLGLEDPPRPGAPASLARCRTAGIRVAMVTGDHPATARAIAEQTGLALPDSPVIDGEALPDDDTALGLLVDHDGAVVARVSPEDKLRIARCLQGRGHVVAMTGDGVNDGPALEQADIGVAMGRSGSDVAREASDLVLLDDDFGTIITAVEQGRATFSNIRRFLTYHLTDNVAELTPFVVWVLSAGRFPLALGVLQILFLDIGTDLLPALALGAEPPGAHVLERPVRTGHLVDRRLLLRVFGVLGPVEAVAEMVAFVVAFVALGWRPGSDFPTASALAAASGAAFAAVVVGQAANALACRSTIHPAWAVRTRNPLMRVALTVQLGLLAVLLWFPPLADLLGQAAPPAPAWLVVVLGAGALVVVDAIHKRFGPGRRLRSLEA